MRQWKHSFQTIRHILTNQFPYSRLRLATGYFTLILAAFINRFFHRHQKVHTHRFLGFRISFRSFPEFVGLVEEIFVYQVYRFQPESSNPIIIDAGANIGVATLYFKRCFPHCQIMCFEPDIDNFELLHLNMQQNDMEHITLHRLALSDVEGTVKLYRTNGHGSVNSTLIASGEQYITDETESGRLSTFIHSSVDLLKLDVEGSENTIILELTGSGKLALIESMVIEYHPSKAGTPVESLVGTMEQAGFSSDLRTFGGATAETLIRFNRQ